MMKSVVRNWWFVVVCVCGLAGVGIALVGCSSMSMVRRPNQGEAYTQGVPATAPEFTDAPNFDLSASAPLTQASGNGGFYYSGAISGAGALVNTPAHHELDEGMAPGEELWVIEKAAPGPVADGEAPGGGELMTRDAQSKKEVAVPLKHTDVAASIAAYIATVEVTQQYQNPYDGKIEAVYVFPLPHNAAVNEFIMTIGERKIRGIIRERAEAEKIYNEAKGQGYVASLMTQERPNIFTQTVANIEPGKSIDVDIKYFQTLSYVDGWYEYVFPMVVGPRFNPPGSTQGVGAVPRGKAGASGQATEVQYLKPDERSGHDISLSVHLDAGMKIEQIDSRNHRVDVRRMGESAADVTLAAGDTIPNKDFVLRYKVAGDTLKTVLMTQKEGNGGYFTLVLYPPESLSHLPRQPLEFVFTLDVSGSQAGAPLEQEKAATRWALQHMGAQDTFQVIRFGNTAQRLFPQGPQQVNEGNVGRALGWIAGFEATEGTMLVEGVRASLDFPHDPNRLRVVSFMTDGFIGNEAEALAEIHRLLGPSRIFSFGVGSSTNRYLLEHMAKMGNGAAAFLGLNDDAGQVMEQFFNRASHPAMTDVTIDWGDLKIDDVYPRRLGDLFVGRPLIVTGRFSGGGAGTIRVHGRAGNEPTTITVPVNFDDATGGYAGIAAVWARMKMADLGDQATYAYTDELPQQIRATALEYGLMSQFTAFVAVDSMTRTSGDHGTSVAVPVPVPDGVKYETTVAGEK